MKKSLIQFVVVITLMMCALTIVPQAYAAKPALPLTKSDELGNVPDAPAGDTAEQQIKTGVAQIADMIKPIIGAIAILMIVIAGMRMVLAQGDTSAIDTQKNAVFYGIIGLMMISMASDMQRIFGFTTPQDAQIQDCPINPSDLQKFFLSPSQIFCRVTLFNSKVQLIITFIKYILGSLAVFEVVTSGMRLISYCSTEDKTEQDKKRLLGSAIGLTLIILSNTIINKVFYKLDFSKPPTDGVHPGLDPARGLAEIAGVTNFIVTFVGPAAILVLIIGGVMYVSAFGNEEQMTKGRRMIISALVGIIVIYGAFGIVSTFIARQF